MANTGLIAEYTTVKGAHGDEVDAYYARPLGSGPFPGIVVIHHAPGWDEWTTEIVRRFAHHGYAAISTHLYHRFGPGSPDDVAARARSSGGMVDADVMGDVAGAIAFLRAQPEASGKVGAIGFCSGGRHIALAVAQVDGLDAAVDCWGGGVVVEDRSTLTANRPVPPIDLVPQVKTPLLGIFGNDDQNPSPAQVDQHEAELKKHGKTYEFHRYDGAGHAFFAWERPMYRQEQAVDAWTKVFAFYEKYLGAPVASGAAAS